MNSFNFVYPSKSGENLIDGPINYSSPMGVIVLIFLISVFIFWVIGFLVKAMQSSDDVRKKYFILSLSVFIFIICAMLDGLAALGIGLIILRFGVIFSLWLMYFGFLRYLGVKK